MRNFVGLFRPIRGSIRPLCRAISPHSGLNTPSLSGYLAPFGAQYALFVGLSRPIRGSIRPLAPLQPNSPLSIYGEGGDR